MSILTRFANWLFDDNDNRPYNGKYASLGNVLEKLKAADGSLSNANANLDTASVHLKNSATSLEEANTKVAHVDNDLRQALRKPRKEIARRSINPEELTRDSRSR